LNAVRAIGGYDRKLAALARVAASMHRSFGLKLLRPPADEDLHDLIVELYEEIRPLVTTGLDFKELGSGLPAQPPAA
jgi:hypothetical protein